MSHDMHIRHDRRLKPVKAAEEKGFPHIKVTRVSFADRPIGKCPSCKLELSTADIRAVSKDIHCPRCERVIETAASREYHRRIQNDQG